MYSVRNIGIPILAAVFESARAIPIQRRAEDKSSTMNAAEIAGTIIGSITAIFAAIAIFQAWRFRRSQKQREEAQPRPPHIDLTLPASVTYNIHYHQYPPSGNVSHFNRHFSNNVAIPTNPPLLQPNTSQISGQDTAMPPVHSDVASPEPIQFTESYSPVPPEVNPSRPKLNRRASTWSPDIVVPVA
ncbi:hypothetical protein BZA77DRAFT_347188 [Pyronema omphalodes]|nr:hypothetical protein BZA77DRAFT_347188 [Pyronema omphalodes]